MITTIHRVSIMRGDEERVVLETTDIKEARERDAQLDTAMSLLHEAERLIKAGSVRLPKGFGYDRLELTLEDLFIGLSEDKDGFRRALKGEPFSSDSVEPSKPKPRRQAQRKAEVGRST